MHVIVDIGKPILMYPGTIIYNYSIVKHTTQSKISIKQAKQKLRRDAKRKVYTEHLLTEVPMCDISIG